MKNPLLTYYFNDYNANLIAESIGLDNNFKTLQETYQFAILFFLLIFIVVFFLAYNINLNIKMIAEEEKHNFNLGQNIDVRDTAKKWVNG